MKREKKQRCAYSNKIIEGRECVLTAYIKEYIIKLFPELQERI